MCVSPTPMKSASATSLTTTMTLLARGAFARAAQQQPGDDHHDARTPGTFTRTGSPARAAPCQQAVDVGVGAEERRPVAGGQPVRQAHADAAQQRREVVAPGDRDGDVADRVLEDQVPADDPGHELARAWRRCRRTRCRPAESSRPAPRSRGPPARRRRRAGGTRTRAPGPAP